MADVSYLFTAEFHFFFLIPGIFRRKAGLEVPIQYPSQSPCDQLSRTQATRRRVVRGLHAPPTGITIPRKRLDQYLILLAICVGDLCQEFL